MKRVIFFIFIFSLSSIVLNAQEEEVTKKKDKPVRSPYETTILIDFPTTLNPSAGALQLLINHRFGVVKNISDLYGIYAPSNVRMSLEYGITPDISIGFSTEKNNKAQELHWKWTFLNQTRSGRIPVSIAYYGNVGLDARNEDFFGDKYAFTNRFNYFNELIISRKFNDKLTAQVAGSYSHFNITAEGQSWDFIGAHVAGRYKIWSNNSLIFEYTHPFAFQTQDPDTAPEPGLTLGMEFGSSTHGFQVFASNYDKLNPQLNISRNRNDFFGGDILLGFNITVRF